MLSEPRGNIDLASDRLHPCVNKACFIPRVISIHVFYSEWMSQRDGLDIVRMFLIESVSLIVGEADFTGSFTDSDHAGT